MRSKQFTLFSFLFALFAFNQLFAQSEPPKVEIFGGYSYINSEGAVDFHGFNASVAGNLNRWFGIKGDLAGYYDPGPFADLDVYTFLFGPQFKARGERFQPFAHVLLGAIRRSVDGSFGSFSDTNFGLALGGGLDIRVNDSIQVRVFQLDYIREFTDVVDFNSGRVSAGVVFTF